MLEQSTLKIAKIIENKKIELPLKIQIIKSKKNYLLDLEFNRKKEVKFLKLQLNQDYISNKNSKIFLTLILQISVIIKI